jgi:hypothetical protein
MRGPGQAAASRLLLLRLQSIIFNFTNFLIFHLFISYTMAKKIIIDTDPVGVFNPSTHT